MRRTLDWLRRGVAVATLAALLSPPVQGASPFGRWALTLPDGGAGWLELTEQDGWYDGSILWGGGSVLPLAHVSISGDRVLATRIREVERKDAAGTVVRVQRLTETLEGRAGAATMTLTHVVPRADGRGFERQTVEGRRIPPLPPRPDLDQVRYGPPIELFNGRDLTGWRLIDPAHANGWRAEDGALVNEPVPAGPERRWGNLRTVDEFSDFHLTFEVNVPEGSNSGVYLRGIYEVQILDSSGRPPDSHHMGAIYSRIRPRVAAELPAGQWQTLAVTLVERHVTVVLNGVTIIANEPLAGCTGGALWSDEFRPGPIYLQGDHGPIRYRNFVLRPVVR